MSDSQQNAPQDLRESTALDSLKDNLEAGARGLGQPALQELKLPEGPIDSTAVVPVTTLQQYLAEVRRYPFLSKEEELRLFDEYKVQGSREAAVKLILANLRVSVAMAYEYLHTGADQMDLIQEGNVGLMQAIRKFDPTKNVRIYAY